MDTLSEALYIIYISEQCIVFSLQNGRKKAQGTN